MRALAANPRFKIVKPSGKGFIIGGRKWCPKIDRGRPLARSLAG